MQNQKFSKNYFENLQKKVMRSLEIDEKDLHYFVFKGEVRNQAYNSERERINILYKNGGITDLISASDNMSLKAFSNSVTKYFICYPKNL